VETESRSIYCVHLSEIPLNMKIECILRNVVFKIKDNAWMMLRIVAVKILISYPNVSIIAVNYYYYYY
jgi:hypothetical protein